MNNYSNYGIGEEYDEPKYNKKRVNKNIKSSFLIGIILIIIALSLLIFGKGFSSNPYSNLEKQMIEASKNYVNNNKLNLSNNLYFNVADLSISLSDNCNSLSGVIVLNKTYYPYLVCDDYESKIIENNDEYMTLNGDLITFISKERGYQEIGYNLKKDVSIKTANYVGSEKGVYQIQYNVINNNRIMVDTLRRLVIVVDDSLIESMYPNLSLVGDELIYLKEGEEYKEYGAIAIDQIDGAINEKIRITGNLNYMISGEYFINYKVTNSRGFTSYVTRKIIVRGNYDNTIEVNYYITPIDVVNDSKKITLYIDSKEYQKIILPNGIESIEKIVNYEVFENGEYLFIIYDKDGNIKEEKIMVNNIDKLLPVASCSAITYNDNTIVNVSANDESGIASYQYKVNDTFNYEIFSSSYNVTVGDAKKVIVSVKDIAGNVTDAVCTIEDQVVRKQEIKIDNNKKNIPCGLGPNYNAEMFKYIKYAGYKTRGGVVAAAIYYSSTIPYKIPYFWSGGHYHEYKFADYGVKNPSTGDEFIGISKYFGCQARMEYEGTDVQKHGLYYAYGLDCSGFVGWAIMNGGYYTGDKNQKMYIPSNGKYSSIGGVNVSTVSLSKARGIVKAGDLAYHDGHVGMIIDVTDTYIVVAEEMGGKHGTKITKQGYNTTRFTGVVLMDNFYNNYKKNTPLWSGFQ